MNIYSGMENSLNSYKEHVVNASYPLPLIVSEWGIPAANSSGELTEEEFKNEIRETMNPQGMLMRKHSGFVAGAQYFEWTDEWWKDGNPEPWVHRLPKSNEWPEQWWGAQWNRAGWENSKRWPLGFG